MLNIIPSILQSLTITDPGEPGDPENPTQTGQPYLLDSDRNYIFIDLEEWNGINDTNLGFFASPVIPHVIGVTQAGAKTLAIELSRSLTWWEATILRLDYYSYTSQVPGLKPFVGKKVTGNIILPKPGRTIWAHPNGNPNNPGTKTSPKSLKWVNENCDNTDLIKLVKSNYDGYLFNRNDGTTKRGIIQPRVGGKSENEPLTFEFEAGSTIKSSGPTIHHPFWLQGLKNIVIKDAFVEGQVTYNYGDNKPIGNITSITENGLINTENITFYNLTAKDTPGWSMFTLKDLDNLKFLKCKFGRNGQSWIGTKADPVGTGNDYGDTFDAQSTAKNVLFSDMECGELDPIGGGGHASWSGTGINLRMFYSRSRSYSGIIEPFGTAGGRTHAFSNSQNNDSQDALLWRWVHRCSFGNDLEGWSGDAREKGPHEGNIKFENMISALTETSIQEHPRNGISTVSRDQNQYARHIYLMNFIVYNVGACGWNLALFDDGLKHEMHEAVNGIFEKCCVRNHNQIEVAADGRGFRTLGDKFNNPVNIDIKNPGNTPNSHPTFDVKLSHCNIRGDQGNTVRVNAGNYSGTVKTAEQWNAAEPGSFRGLSSLPPQFVSDNPDSLDDFILKDTSPLRGKGTYIASTTAGGNSTTIPVDNVFKFRGANINSGGMHIRIGRHTLEVKALVSVPTKDQMENHTKTGSIEVDRAISFSNGDKIYLAYNGEAPNIGWNQL